MCNAGPENFIDVRNHSNCGLKIPSWNLGGVGRPSLSGDTPRSLLPLTTHKKDAKNLFDRKIFQKILIFFRKSQSCTLYWKMQMRRILLSYKLSFVKMNEFQRALVEGHQKAKPAEKSAQGWGKKLSHSAATGTWPS